MDIAGNEPDVILLTEVIPKAQRTPISNALLALPNYEFYTSFDPDKLNLGGRGERGVAIYIRSNLRAALVSFPHAAFKEHLLVRIQLHRQDYLVICCVYRSPSSDGFQSMTELRSLLSLIDNLKPSHFLLAGDFNFPQIDWVGEFSRATTGHPSHLLLDLMHDFFLFQHIREATRSRLGEMENTLDLVFTNEEGMLSNLEYRPGLGRSDHLSLRFRIRCYLSVGGTSRQKLDFGRADFPRLNQMVSGADWGSRDLSTEDLYHHFRNTLSVITAECVPIMRSRPNRKNIYMTSAALRLKNRKNQLWRVFRSSGDIIDRGRFAHCAAKLRKLTRQLQRNHEHRLALNAKENPKAFWKYVNSRLKTKSKVEDLRNPDGVLEASDEEKAMLLNSFFASVFTVEDLSRIPPFDVRCAEPFLEDLEIHPQRVALKLASMKKNGSPGPDLVHARILFEARDTLAIPLAQLFRSSLDSGRVPQDWKLGSIVPIHKKGDKHSPGNYRPVSLTAIPCKVMESIIRDELLGHLTLHNLLSPEQHGFRPKRSCDSQMLEMLDDWSRAMEANHAIDAVYMDFRKAFDSVPHARLLHKLYAYGVRGKVLNWIRAFLTDRRQRVVVGASESDWLPVLSGVPQGSVLGPVLFLVYINDLPDHVKSNVKIFADDTKLYTRANDSVTREMLQGDIDSLLEWSARWQLPFNVEKCSVLHIGSTNCNHVYTLSGAPLSSTGEERDLGVVMDSDLKFRQQAAIAVSKATRLLAVIRRSFANLDQTTLPRLYKAIVRPLVEYGNVSWGPFNRADQKLIERVQRRATRIVPTLRQAHYTDRLRALRLPSLYYRRRRGDMLKIFQLLHGGIDQDYAQFFHMDPNTRTRGHAWKLVKPNAVSRVRRNAFGCRAINDWNGLPPSVVGAQSLNEFKNRLDIHWAHIRYTIPDQD